MSQQPQATVQRAVKRQQPQQFEYLRDLCKGFLKAQIPESNIILEADFAKFIPLFNQEAVNELGEDGVKELATEYRGRFSLQHEIRIISTETVEEAGDDVTFFNGDRRYHKVILILPPLFKPLKTLNELGPKVPTLIDALMTSTARKDNLALGATDYCASIIQAMRMVNPPKDKLAYIEKFKKTEAKFMQIKNGTNTPAPKTPAASNNSQDGAITTGDDLFVW